MKASKTPAMGTKKHSESTPLHPRLQRELETVTAMIVIFCRAHHGKGRQLCLACRELNDYAAKRLRNCIFQQDKPTCGSCSIQCYKPWMKKRIIEVMRYSGPRMMFTHPLLACAHLLDERRAKKANKDQHKSIYRGTKP